MLPNGIYCPSNSGFLSKKNCTNKYLFGKFGDGEKKKKAIKLTKSVPILKWQRASSGNVTTKNNNKNI